MTCLPMFIIFTDLTSMSIVNGFASPVTIRGVLFSQFHQQALAFVDDLVLDFFGLRKRACEGRDSDLVDVFKQLYNPFISGKAL